MRPIGDDGTPAGSGKPSEAGPRGAPARTRGRQAALDVLFEADQRGLDPLPLAEVRLAGEGVARAFARTLVAGVAAHGEEVDEALETYSLGWPLARMPAVDRSIARLGAYEILFGDDVPDPVVLGEAADLAGRLSTAKSATFISGLLARISAMKAR